VYEYVTFAVIVGRRLIRVAAKDGTGKTEFDLSHCVVNKRYWL